MSLGRLISTYTKATALETDLTWKFDHASWTYQSVIDVDNTDEGLFEQMLNRQSL